jgi:uncharacterized Zn finger protein (UPF0148 family)
MKKNFCPNCGTRLEKNDKFCPNCGVKIIADSNQKKSVKENDTSKKNEKISGSELINQLNKDIELQNNQTGTVKKAWYFAGFFLLIIIVAFMDLDSFPIHPALMFLSFFFLSLSVIIAIMFRSREKKLQKLISGESLIAEWTLTREQKKKYANYLFKHESGKNQIILFSISFIAIIVFGIFILVIDEGKLAMFLVLLGLIAFLAAFAFGMPLYYRFKNLRGDGKILLGGKYAYINGYFHNWDFPLSGLSKVKPIKDPFYGINLIYYYTDRTLRNSEELFIPANEDIDLKVLAEKLKKANK